MDETSSPDGHLRWPPEAYAREWRGTSSVPWIAVAVAIVVGIPLIAIFAPGFYWAWIDNETTGLQEISHALLPAICCIIAVRLLFEPVVRADPLMVAWVAIIALGCLYLAGEEISWGQHWLGWATPEEWRELNDQQELNLHNTSSWLDQRPRTVLEIGIIAGTLVLPFVWMRRSVLPHRFGPSYPPMHLWPVAIALLVVDIGNDVLEWFVGSLSWRSGELEETLIVVFMLGYMLTLVRRVRTVAAGKRVAGIPAT